MTTRSTKLNHRYFKVPATVETEDGDVKRGTGHICVAMKRLRTKKNVYRFSASFKSPADVLDKTFGMNVATDRLNCRRKNTSFIARGRNLDEAFQNALVTMFTRTKTRFSRGKKQRYHFVPDWLFDAVVGKVTEL